MTRWDYTEHPGQPAWDFLAQQAIARELEEGYARERVIRERRAACARKGRV